MFNAALYERTCILLGEKGIANLQRTNVFLAGAGGVGGHCAEALVRAGIGQITLIDHDVVSLGNKNRQLIALDSTIGKSKVIELAQRLRDVNASCEITALEGFLTPENVQNLLSRQKYDFVLDCIDSIECKVALLAAAVQMKLRVYSSGGAGGRLDPSCVQLADLFDTCNDRLSRACRTRLRNFHVKPGDVHVVFSSEKALPPLAHQRQDDGGRDRSVNGTISYMPSIFGLFLASAVIRCAKDPEAHDKAIARERKTARKREHRQLKRLAKREANFALNKQARSEQWQHHTRRVDINNTIHGNNNNNNSNVTNDEDDVFQTTTPCTINKCTTNNERENY